MRGETGPPTLIDPRGKGGVVALGGFDYQVWNGLLRLPSWLNNPGFEELIFEGLEDFEARFFAPHAPGGRILERYQAKSGNLSPADVRGVLRSFLAFEEAYPGVTRVQTLVTPQLPSTLGWLSDDPARVRRARPFYAPFPDVVAASDDALQSRLVASLEETLGRYVADFVDVEECQLPDRDNAVRAFAIELARTFAIDAPTGRIAAAFDALESLVRRSAGVPLARDVLVRTIEDSLDERLPLSSMFPLHVRSDRNEPDVAALEIDARAFCGGAVAFPPSDIWRAKLVEPLEATARWLSSRRISRVSLGGSFRITTAMVLGWSLRSATGFELEVPTRAGAWSTDDRPGPGELDPGWSIRVPTSLHCGELAVSVGVIRDPSSALPETSGVQEASVLRLHLPRPIDSGPMAQASASVVKRAVDDARVRLAPRGIRLYFAGPAAFAVVLGHRWNAMRPTQLHEYSPSEHRYVETARI